MKTRLSVNVRLLRDHEGGLIDENPDLHYQLVFFNVGKERCQACVSAEKRAIYDAKQEFANMKDTMHSI